MAGMNPEMVLSEDQKKIRFRKLNKKKLMMEQEIGGPELAGLKPDVKRRTPKRSKSESLIKRLDQDSMGHQKNCEKLSLEIFKGTFT